MTTPCLEVASDIRYGAAGLTEFCAELFGSIARSDQRKWGEVYVRGLLGVSGRKSIRRICDQAIGAPTQQGLQQFVNQSPWKWEPVRRALARRVADPRPKAVVIVDTVFPKNGDSSVGVARQYAKSTGRTLNCQLGLAGFLVNRHVGYAVNWRLRLPRSWDEDPGRRNRARLPAEERHLPRWRHLLDMVDEMTVGWGLRTAPVVLDAGDDDDVLPLLRGLRDRGLPFVIRVPEHIGLAHPDLRAHRVLAGSSPGTGQVWLTNLSSAHPGALAELVTSARRAKQEGLPRLRDDFGLGHFEGRSFAGWHHHLTLVSVAHALWTLSAENAPART
jgi:SRSO17 transposase